MEQPKHLCFEWSPGENTRQVNIYLEALASGNTKIRIVEKEWNIDEPGARAAMSQTEGWTDFISCLKAYLYTGVRLR
ncbi:MAG: hypothetical protein EYC69_00310 [Bacteroidetes bacterium]|nr:MAG: hypothetical protein EYC69_00310 [Bacteroidota bacterium]